MWVLGTKLESSGRLDAKCLPMEAAHQPNARLGKCFLNQVKLPSTARFPV